MNQGTSSKWDDWSKQELVLFEVQKTLVDLAVATKNQAIKQQLCTAIQNLAKVSCNFAAERHRRVLES